MNERRTHLLSRRRVLLAAAAATLGACVPRGLRTPTGLGQQPPNSPLAARPVANYWPDVVTAAAPMARQAYKDAAANEATLRYIPCYCGCVGQGHKDNFDCYVSEVRTGGWLILDTHALG